jgi:hypothetical protein
MQFRKENSFLIGWGMRISPAQRFNLKRLLNGHCRTVRATSHMVAALILSKGTAP